MTSSSLGLAPRERAHTILHEVLDRGRALDDVLHSDKRLAKLTERDRAFARNLLATTLRRLGQIDAALADRLDKPLPRAASAARNALRIGVCQILFLDTQTHAAVDTSVALAAQRGPERYKGLVNAILRRVSEEAPDSIAARYPERLNIPDWLYDSWTDAYGGNAAAEIAAACLAVPPTDITVKSDPAGWAERLGGMVLAGDTVRLVRAGDIVGLPGFGDGAWWIQDAAAALPARVLVSAMRAAGVSDVCDLCAAPGGKTMQLAAAGLSVTAVDISAGRLRTVRENLDRTALTASLVEADATGWTPPMPFSAVLLDAPCTATGTIRRHPDIPHLKKPSDVGKQAAVQRKLLIHAADMVKPGGVLLYSVCSLQPAEGIDQVEAFLKARGDFARLPVAPAEAPGFETGITRDGDLLTLPSHRAADGGNDGFYIARLSRRSAS